MRRSSACSHTGVRSVDEATAYVLLKTGQILEQQTGLVNELRIRVRDPMLAREVATRIEEETGYKSVSWQEAHEDLLSSFVIRNIIMFTVVGAILLVASFGTYNIISTITHEKARDIAIMKSLGLNERDGALDLRARGAADRDRRRARRFRARLSAVPRPRLDRDQEPLHGHDLVCRSAYNPMHYAIAMGGGARSRRSRPATCQRARRRGVHPVDIIRGAT